MRTPQPSWDVFDLLARRPELRDEPGWRRPTRCPRCGRGPHLRRSVGIAAFVLQGVLDNV